LMQRLLTAMPTPKTSLPLTASYSSALSQVQTLCQNQIASRHTPRTSSLY
jgi:hypothetical protein